MLRLLDLHLASPGESGTACPYLPTTAARYIINTTYRNKSFEITIINLYILHTVLLVQNSYYRGRHLALPALPVRVCDDDILYPVSIKQNASLSHFSCACHVFVYYLVRLWHFCHPDSGYFSIVGQRCSVCPAGQTSGPGASSCTICPAGVTCKI